MEWLHELFKKSPEIALFLSLAVGYYIGKIKFGSFQLGGVAGSLLVAVLVVVAYGATDRRASRAGREVTP